MDKTRVRLPFIHVVFFVCFLALYVYSVNGVYHMYLRRQETKTQIGHESQKIFQVVPVRLRIPRIAVDAAVEKVGLTAEGEMGTPKNTTDVGWFALGPQPGEKGNAVLAGHLDGKHGETGVFADLSRLKRGDTFFIEDNTGLSTAFVVRESRTYAPGYVYDVFSPSDNAHVNLVTCDGVWNGSKKSYTKRLVVFADLAKK